MRDPANYLMAIQMLMQKFKFLKDFSFKTNFGLNLADAEGTTYQNSQFGDAQNVQGRLTKSTGRQISYTFNPGIKLEQRFWRTFNKSIGRS
jgi:hypothetical protein